MLDIKLYNDMLIYSPYQLSYCVQVSEYHFFV